MNNDKFKIFLLFLITIGLFSCEEKNNNNLYIRHYPETGNVGEFEYIIKGNDSLLHGNYTIYNQDGKIITLGSYIYGEPYGEEIHYFENGNIESIHQVLNREITEESIYNYENGNSRKYVLFEDFGEPIFIVRFDEKGNVVNYEGYPVIELYRYREERKTGYKIGDTLKYRYIYANMPSAIRKFDITLEDFDNDIVNRKISKEKPTFIEVEEIISKKGNNKIKAVIELRFKDSLKTAIKDSISFNFEVNG